ncbi:MAG: hypothetical protein A6F70_05470 [Cycloclasticus sp. symbiont of Bathymodiolus heckerae]|nr:MAG: hypothetical protein A6F70_05470 [Cycloclasticus sp. symbiont of Bathymodiolus heckerae]
MAFNKKIPVVFAVLALVLVMIWGPIFSSFADLFSYAKTALYNGVTLLDIFKAELLILCIVWLVLMSYSKSNDTVDGDAYVRRHVILMMFVIGQVFVGFFVGGFWAHQDASEYQIVRGADAVMPAQAIILLICYPLYLFFGGSAFIYAKTRLAIFLKGKELSFMVLTFTPWLLLPFNDASLLQASNDLVELFYLAVYWILSTVWVVWGVGFLILRSAKEVLRGLKDPYGDI